MAKVEMYCSGFCSYCVMAKRLFETKGIEYTEYRIDEKPELRPEMEQRSRQRTVPQIFINGHHVGGYTDLAQLDRNDELDSMLAGNS